MARFCTNCGNEVPAEYAVCTNCGTPVNGGVAPAQQTVVVNAAQPKQTNGLAIAGFVVSLVSFLLCCGSFSIISLILSIIGTIKAKDYNGNGKAMGIIGIVLSVLGILIFTIFMIFYAAVLVDEMGYNY